MPRLLDGLAVAHHEAGVVRPGRRQGLSDLLLQDDFRNRVLKPVAAPSAFGGVYSFADFSQVPETATTAFWNDEIHLTEAGFAVLAAELNRELRARLPTAKRAR